MQKFSRFVTDMRNETFDWLLNCKQTEVGSKYSQSFICPLQMLILQNHIQFYQLKQNKSQKKMGKINKRMYEQDEDYDPKSRTDSKFRIYKKKSRDFFNGNHNKWTPQQNLVFLNFLKKEKTIISCQKGRKETKVFVRLSAEVKTRSPDQCRSHHQKMIKHHNDINGIIKYLELKKIDNFQLKEDSFDTFDNQNDLQQTKKKKTLNFQQKQNDMRQIEDKNIVTEENIWNMINKQVWIGQEQELNEIQQNF